MVNKFIHYQLLDEREEQLINKAGAESFSLFIGLVLLSYLVAVLAPSLGVTYYSRFHFTILGCFFLTLAITALLMLQNYQLNIEIYQHNPLNLKYLSAWAITYVIYLPWVFIGNLGLKSYGEWAQKKFEQDMDELESGE